MNNFEKKLDRAVEELTQGKSSREVFKFFSEAEQIEAQVLLSEGERLQKIKNAISPDREKFSLFLSDIPTETVQNILETREKKISFSWWKILVPTGVVAAFSLLLLFQNNRSSFSVPESVVLSPEAQKTLQPENIPELAVFQNPVLQPTERADELVAGLLLDMNQETSVLQTEAQNVSQEILNQSNQLQTLPINAEKEI